MGGVKMEAPDSVQEIGDFLTKHNLQFSFATYGSSLENSRGFTSSQMNGGDIQFLLKNGWKFLKFSNCKKESDFPAIIVNPTVKLREHFNELFLQ